MFQFHLGIAAPFWLSCTKAQPERAALGVAERIEGVCVLVGDGPGGMLRVQCGAGHWHRIQMRAHFLVAQARTNKQQ